MILLVPWYDIPVIDLSLTLCECTEVQNGEYLTYSKIDHKQNLVSSIKVVEHLT